MTGHGKLSPAFQAAMKFREIPDRSLSWDEVLEAHLVNGYVIASPEVFILARPVEKDGPEELILNPAYRFTYPNAWFIYLAAGRLDCCWHYYPIPYLWAGWQRRGMNLRFWPMAKIQRKVL